MSRMLNRSANGSAGNRDNPDQANTLLLWGPIFGNEPASVIGVKNRPFASSDREFGKIDLPEIAPRKSGLTISRKSRSLQTLGSMAVSAPLTIPLPGLCRSEGHC